MKAAALSAGSKPRRQRRILDSAAPAMHLRDRLFQHAADRGRDHVDGQAIDRDGDLAVLQDLGLLGQTEVAVRANDDDDGSSAHFFSSALMRLPCCCRYASWMASLFFRSEISACVQTRTHTIAAMQKIATAHAAAARSIAMPPESTLITAFDPPNCRTSLAMSRNSWAISRASCSGLGVSDPGKLCIVELPPELFQFGTDFIQRLYKAVKIFRRSILFRDVHTQIRNLFCVLANAPCHVRDDP